MDCGCVLPRAWGPNKARTLGFWSGDGGCLTEADPKIDLINSTLGKYRKQLYSKGPGYLKLFTLIQNHMLGATPQLCGERSPFCTAAEDLRHPSPKGGSGPSCHVPWGWAAWYNGPGSA